MIRKTALVTCVLAFALCVTGTVFGAGEQEEAPYPDRPISIVIPFGAGGNTDLLVRSMAEVLEQKLGQPLVATNVTGGGGTIGTGQAVASEPDGYTIVLAGSGPLYTQPFIIDLQYDRDDYVVIAGVSYVPRVMVAVPSMPYSTVEEFMAYAAANPGNVQVGIAAVGSTDFFGMIQLQADHGVEFNLIPQGGGNAQRVAVVGAQVDVAAMTSAEARPLVEAGQVKALGLMHGTRDPLFPDLPTFAEAGYPVESGVGFYMLAPAGTPEDVRATLEEAVRATLSDPGYLETAAQLNLTVAYQTSADAAAEIDRFYNHYQELSVAIGLGE